MKPNSHVKCVVRNVWLLQMILLPFFRLDLLLIWFSFFRFFLVTEFYYWFLYLEAIFSASIFLIAIKVVDIWTQLHDQTIENERKIYRDPIVLHNHILWLFHVACCFSIWKYKCLYLHFQFLAASSYFLNSTLMCSHFIVHSMLALYLSYTISCLVILLSFSRDFLEPAQFVFCLSFGFWFIALCTLQK